MNRYIDLKATNIKELMALTLREDVESNLISELVAKYESPRELYNMTIQELKEIKGIGNAKAIQIKAVFELGVRLVSTPQMTKQVIKSPGDVVNLVMPEMRLLDREVFKTIHLNTKNHVEFIETVSVGSLNSSIVHPREVFKSAIKRGSASLILIH